MLGIGVLEQILQPNEVCWYSKHHSSTLRTMHTTYSDQQFIARHTLHWLHQVRIDLQFRGCQFWLLLQHLYESTQFRRNSHCQRHQQPEQPEHRVVPSHTFATYTNELVDLTLGLRVRLAESLQLL
jgi:hypothetical protein